MAPTSHKGNITQTGAGTHAALLKTIEDLLGVPFMNQGNCPARRICGRCSGCESGQVCWVIAGEVVGGS